jgi:phosphoribosylformylglycinamidine synthase
MDDPSMRKSMDFKAAGNCVYVLGATYNELGGSHYYALNKAVGQNVPKVKAKEGLKNFKAIFNANKAKTIESIHDCSEGGIAIALAEMCFAGMLGAEIDTKKIPLGEKIERADYVLFSESNSRFIIEVSPKNKKNFEKRMRGCAYAEIGKVVAGKKLSITHNGKKVIDSDIDKLKKAWKETLKW